MRPCRRDRLGTVCSVSGQQLGDRRAGSIGDSEKPGDLPAVHEAWLPREHPLHRPRHGGKQLTALICAFLFFAAPVLSWVFGARAEPVENRALRPFPSVTSGWGFFTGLGEWATDHFVLREQAVRSVQAISRGVFGEPAQLDVAPVEPPVGAGRAEREKNNTPDPDVFPDVVRGKNDWLFLGQDVSYKCLPEMELDRIIAGLRRWRSVVEASGREFRLVLPPDKSTMYPQYLPDDYVGEKCMRELRADFWRRAPELAGAIDMRDPLREAARSQGRPIFSKLDTHWRHAGGVAMTRELAESLKPGISDGWRVSQGREYEHSADIPELLGQQRHWTVQSYELAPDGGTDNSKFVASDFHEPLRLSSAPRSGMIDRPTRMIADSFTQFASPYLGAVFSDLTIAHPETVARNPNKMANTLAEGEVVVFEFSERFLAGGRYEMLSPRMAEKVGKVLADHPIG